MELPVLVETTPAGRFRALAGEPFHASAEGDDAAQAVQSLARLIEQRLEGGARIAVLSVNNGAVRAKLQPLAADDAYKTDWVFRELQDAIAEGRRLEESSGA